MSNRIPKFRELTVDSQVRFETKMAARSPLPIGIPWYPQITYLKTRKKIAKLSSNHLSLLFVPGDTIHFGSLGGIKTCPLGLVANWK